MTQITIILLIIYFTLNILTLLFNVHRLGSKLGYESKNPSILLKIFANIMISLKYLIFGSLLFIFDVLRILRFKNKS